jgi:hypothetical protein
MALGWVIERAIFITQKMCSQMNTAGNFWKLPRFKNSYIYERLPSIREHNKTVHSQVFLVVILPEYLRVQCANCGRPPDSTPKGLADLTHL